MSELKPEPKSRSTFFKMLLILPALTLLLVLSLFALQALRVPTSQGQRAGSTVGDDLPVLGQLPAFALTERSGAPLDQRQLTGKVWIADFIFTSCQAECPLMNVEMQKLQQAFAAATDFKLVSFTVDPETDTPERLRAYADTFGADAGRWLFATGEREALHQLATAGFKLPVQQLDQEAHSQHGQASPAAPAFPDAQRIPDDRGEAHAQHGSTGAAGPFLHSQKFVLVDRQLRIRGYYDSTDPAAIRALIEKDVPHLLQGS
ncbi:MAG: hypothetical protein CVV27_14805 [Candidatus Melainabacteria bacterium HGW-Melainabacteria-1]|nr:MAG: hypothetical protein CVV27_14805 [Candidatus Melainabacteria bacterium HGW-Melainabacteria-1]